MLVDRQYAGHRQYLLEGERRFRKLTFSGMERKPQNQWQIFIQKFLVHAPLQDPILSFSRTFSSISAHVGGPRPTMGNPGSATENVPFLEQ